MDMEEIEDEMQFTGERHVVVVGGGIAGMYCARELAKGDYLVTLLEVRQLLGGRIETLDLRGFSGKSALARHEVFKGQCGPMRFELELQPRFAELCRETGIALKEFPSPRGEAPSQYALKPDEHSPSQLPLSSLELLKLGVFRMFGQETTFDKSETAGRVATRFLRGHLGRIEAGYPATVSSLTITRALGRRYRTPRPIAGTRAVLAIMPTPLTLRA
jgi:monoamine oxidase